MANLWYHQFHPGFHTWHNYESTFTNVYNRDAQEYIRKVPVSMPNRQWQYPLYHHEETVESSESEEDSDKNANVYNKEESSDEDDVEWEEEDDEESVEELSDEEEQLPQVLTIRTNYEKGRNFEKQIAKVLDTCPQVRYYEEQVECFYELCRGFADFLVTLNSGKKLVIEAKNYDGYPIKKKDVMQVHIYAKCFKAKPLLVVSNTTSMPASEATEKLAKEKRVDIITFKEFRKMMKRK